MLKSLPLVAGGSKIAYFSIQLHTKTSLSPVGPRFRNRQVSWLSFFALSAFPTCVSDIFAWAPLTVAGLLRIPTGFPFQQRPLQSLHLSKISNLCYSTRLAFFLLGWKKNKKRYRSKLIYTNLCEQNIAEKNILCYNYTKTTVFQGG